MQCLTMRQEIQKYLGRIECRDHMGQIHPTLGCVKANAF